MATELLYPSVNDAINDVFFDGRHAGQHVYLTLDTDARVELATRLGVDPDVVEDVVCECVSKSLRRTGNPYEPFILDGRAWRRRGASDPPPFTVVLFMLAHAATLMAAEGSFASNNYYHRLSQVTGLEREVLARHRGSMELMWKALNDWLVAKNHMLGRPTARPMSSTWRYVGWSISQAIVRAGDRELFHDMFQRFGFSGSEALSARDMERYIATWMLTSRPNTRLRNAWRNTALQERVAEAALAELASWNAKAATMAATGGQSRPMRLSLMASIVPRFPKPALELHLGHAGDVLGHADLQGNGNRFTIANDLFGDFATISPPPFGTRNAYLGQAHAFERVGGGQGLEWRPRLVMPLSRRGSLWMEVPRVSFGVPHAVLVRDTQNLARDVEAYLMQAAMKEPTIATPDMLAGLPAGWVLYTDVQVGRNDVNPSKDDLDCLVPVGEQGVLEVSEGLQLWREFYHARSTPTLTLIAPPGPATIECLSLPSAETIVASASSEGHEVRLAIDATALPPPSGVEVRGYRSGKLVDTREVYFRDAGNPLPLARDGKGMLAYASMIVSAGPHDPGARPNVVGFLARGTFASCEPADQPVSLDLPQGGDEDAQEIALADGLATHAANQACIERGYHIWRFPMVPEDTPRGTPFHGRCTDCSQELVILYRRRARPATTAMPERRPLPPMQVPGKPSGVPSVDHDLLLDALGFVGSGSWGRFESLLQLGEAAPYLARQVAQDLFLLGFIDLELRQGTNAVKSWCVTPPALIFASERRAFLSGFRSASLLASLRETASVAGGRMVEAPQGGRPAAAWIEGLDASAARDAFADIRDPHGRRLGVVSDAGPGLARACLSLGGLRDALAPASVGKPRNLQRFDTRTAKWIEAESASPLGAYRWNEGMQCYAFIDEGRAAHCGPHNVIKLLAARADGMRLHAYDKESKAFSCTLGCEPPGLLARALVACSGNLPTVSRGILSYGDVPPDVASCVLAALYNKDAL